MKWARHVRWQSALMCIRTLIHIQLRASPYLFHSIPCCHVSSLGSEVNHASNDAIPYGRPKKSSTRTSAFCWPPGASTFCVYAEATVVEYSPCDLNRENMSLAMTKLHKYV